MIIFDLKCTNSHTFEGWFEGRSEFESEKESGRLACPMCGDREIGIVPTGGYYSKRQGRKDGQTPAGDSFVKVLTDYFEKNFDNVGKKFAEEAIKMHFGETDLRNIRGIVTDEEEKELNEECVEFIKIPMRKLQS